MHAAAAASAAAACYSRVDVPLGPDGETRRRGEPPVAGPPGRAAGHRALGRLALLAPAGSRRHRAGRAEERGRSGAGTGAPLGGQGPKRTWRRWSPRPAHRLARPRSRRASTRAIRADTPVCGLILNGQIRVPLDYPPLPTPPSWVSRLGRPCPGAPEREWTPACRAEVQRGAGRRRRLPACFDLAQRAEGVETESGAPLADLALLLALGHPPAGGFTDAHLQALERHVVEHPSFLSGTLVEEASRLAPQNPTTARIAARWAANERALTLLRALRVDRGAGPSAVWLDAEADAWLALVHPIATTGSATAAAPRTRVPRDARSRRRARARLPVGPGEPRRSRLRDRHRGDWRPDDPRRPAVRVRRPRGRTRVRAGPARPPADRAVRRHPQVRRRTPPHGARRDAAPAAVGCRHRPAGRACRARTRSRSVLELADPDALYASYRRRLWLAAGLVLAATLAALGGLAGAWRAFERQRRLGEMKSNFVASVSHELQSPDRGDAADDREPRARHGDGRRPPAGVLPHHRPGVPPALVARRERPRLLANRPRQPGVHVRARRSRMRWSRGRSRSCGRMPANDKSLSCWRRVRPTGQPAVGESTGRPSSRR